ncbi:hypothetical protein [Latilactobacillus sakei]|uniref:hypothetical protein n=1 Tax=Latilactobacillus sakei TaxID=1599 RepID=UPI00097874B6|nr:hypothetical protein [Latilactobacillus sakei]
MRKLQDLANDDEFEQAHHIIQQIHSNELAEPEDFKRYYYYQGQISLLLQDSPDDALFFFHRAYEQGSYVKNPDIKVRTNLTFNLNYLI